MYYPGSRDGLEPFTKEGRTYFIYGYMASDIW